MSGDSWSQVRYRVQVMRWTWLVALAIWFAWVSVARAATPTPSTVPRIELYTMGPGDDAFSLFGHAALCVFDAKYPMGRCYNYGTTDFSRPVGLTSDFIQGRARFWVSVSPEPVMRDAYRRLDRSVYRQVLPLSDEQARRFASALEQDLRPDRRSYLYHHFDDNCATRLRDHIDTFTGGQLRVGAQAPYGETLRQVVREGFAAYPGLLVLSELVLGRRVDGPATRWEAMFLPAVLRDQVQVRLGASPELISPRKAPVPSGDPRLGRFWIAWVGALFGVSCGLLHASRRRWLSHGGVILAGLLFGGLGLLLTSIAVVSPLPDLRENEVLLVLTPLDLMLVFLRGRWLTWFVRLRIVGLGTVLACGLAGVFVQPLAAPACALLVWNASAALTLHMSRTSGRC